MFKLYVDIYRAIGSPSFEDGQTLYVSVPLTGELKELIDRYQASAEKFGNVDFDYIDGNNVEVEFTVVQYVKGAIFRDVTHFIENTASIKKGNFRNNFYIKSLNYLSGDDYVPNEIARINKITDFIRCLREFASLSMDKEQSMEGERIFFLKPSDGKSSQKAATLKINLTDAIFNYQLEGFIILKALANSDHKEKKSHVEERILLMNNAIAQTLDECEDDDADLEYLVKNWGKINKKYLHDLHAYLTSFSFDAAKKKISDGLIESTTKINNSLGELGTKLFASPALMAALLVIKDSESDVSFYIGILGIVVTSLIIFRSISHYKSQVENLLASFTFNLQEFSKPKKSFSGIVKKEIERISCFKCAEEKRISRTLCLYKLSAIIPILVGLYLIFDRNSDALLYYYSIFRYC